VRDLCPFRKLSPGARRIQNELKVRKCMTLTRGAPGWITSVHTGGIPSRSSPQRGPITYVRGAKPGTSPATVVQIRPCELGVIHLVISAEWVKRTHWICFTVPDDPGMGCLVDLHLFKSPSASMLQSRRKTHRRSSGFGHLRGVRHLEWSCPDLIFWGPAVFLQGGASEGIAPELQDWGRR